MVPVSLSRADTDVPTWRELALVPEAVDLSPFAGSVQSVGGVVAMAVAPLLNARAP
jgi:hypothetical protein